VEPKIRASLMETLGFDQRALGQSVYRSEVLTIIQEVPGVDYVDLDVLQSIPEDIEVAALLEKIEELSQTDQVERQRPAALLPARLATYVASDSSIMPAQMLYLSPEIPETLILTEITS
jgi:hypothetical protein